VKEHLDSFLQHARESYAGPLPAYVVDEFRAYLGCGDFSRGFVHVQCTSCGDAMAVAFSCKVRGLCPSCAGRRMAGSAAHLVDRILPAVPMRQYLLAFPYELSGLAATRPDVLAAPSLSNPRLIRRPIRTGRWGLDVVGLFSGRTTRDDGDEQRYDAKCFQAHDARAKHDVFQGGRV
jgi:hypothetical protein